MKSRFSDNAIALLLTLAVFVGWELAVRIRDVPIYILPAPSRIVSILFENIGMYAEAFQVTFGEAIAGLILGVIAGASAAALLGLIPRLESGVMTLAILVKSTPLVAIAPLLTIWLGFGVLPKIIITALLTFFPVLVNVLSGLGSAESALLDTFRSWNANRTEIFWFVRAPHALPYLFAALKVSGPLALIGAVVAEWTGASGGLGRVMWLAYTNLNLPFLFAAVFLLAASGMGLYGLIHWAEQRVVFWKME
ncbi:MAG: ABC transporter permease [Anaerolineales bacterium]|jgi:ABC-type nitrate/sulfonate/bicarbonate transport system permease component